MKYLKRFNEAKSHKKFETDPQEIIRLLELIAPKPSGRLYSDNEDIVSRVTIHPDGTVDVEGSIIIYTDLKSLPIKFGKVSESFIISNRSRITSLEGCPEECGYFSIEGTNVTSLEGGPRIAEESYIAQGCVMITNLKGAPDTCENFIINGTGVTSLEGSPKNTKNIFCILTNIKNFVGAPMELELLEASDCREITSLEGLPAKVDRIFLNNVALPLWDPTPLKDCEFEYFFLATEKSPLSNLIEAFNPHPFKGFIKWLTPETRAQIFKNFRDSLDYNYIRSTVKRGGEVRNVPAINLFRFKEALAEFDIMTLKGNQVVGYVFVNDNGEEVDFNGDPV